MIYLAKTNKSGIANALALIAKILSWLRNLRSYFNDCAELLQHLQEKKMSGYILLARYIFDIVLRFEILSNFRKITKATFNMIICTEKRLFEISAWILH